LNISELVFTSLGPILYNLIFLILWVSWIDYHYKGNQSKIREYFEKYFQDKLILYSVTAIILVIILFLLFTYANANTDVDDAITSGVEAYLAGHNPYQEDVVVHHLPSGITYGRYHYFPPDLLVYTAFHEIFIEISKFLDPIWFLSEKGIFDSLGTYWFAPLHFLFLIPGYWLVTQIIDWPHSKLIPLFLLMVSPFLFTNSMLMWFYFLIGYYLYEVRENKNVGMIFYIFAASVKYLVGFIIVFYLYQSVQRIWKEIRGNKDYSFIIDEISPFLIGSIALIIVSLPFNLFDVIIAVFLHQGDIVARGEVAQLTGPLLIEILKILNSESFYLLSLIFVLIVSLFILREHSTYEKIIHFSFLSMFILPFYGTELFITLPFYWWFKEGYNLYSKE
jgi:hypothetical protein